MLLSAGRADNTTQALTDTNLRVSLRLTRQALRYDQGLVKFNHGIEAYLKASQIISVEASMDKGRNRKEFLQTPERIGLRYTGIVKEPISEPQEAEACFQVNGKRERAFVPLYAVDESNDTAYGAIIATAGNEVIVEFPPTTLGQSRFVALREDLAQITTGSDQTL